MQGNSKFEVHLVGAIQNFMIFTKMGGFGMFRHLPRKLRLTNAPTFKIEEIWLSLGPFVFALFSEAVLGQNYGVLEQPFKLNILSWNFAWALIYTQAMGKTL